MWEEGGCVIHGEYGFGQRNAMKKDTLDFANL